MAESRTDSRAERHIQHPEGSLARSPQQQARRRVDDHADVSARFRALVAASGEGAPPPEHVASLFGSTAFAHPINDAQKVRVIGDLQQRFGNRYVQRVLAARTPTATEPMPEAPLQRQVADAAADQPVSLARVSPLIHDWSSGQPLDARTRAVMEMRFGHDFSQVRIHTGSPAIRATRAANAQALTRGRDIYFGGGRYQPSTQTGLRLLAHELTHVVQQTRHADMPRGTVSHPGDAAEQEAARIGAAFSATAATAGSPPAVHAAPSAMVQRQATGATEATTLSALEEALQMSLPEDSELLPEEEEPVSYPEELSPEDARRLHYARTTLARVEPLAEREQKILEKAIPGAPILSLIKERDQKKWQLYTKIADFRRLPIERRWPVAKEIDPIRTDVERLDRMIQAICGALGVSERGLVKLIVVDFPRLFIERAKQIAITQLDQNKEIAEKEKERFGLSKLMTNPEDFTGLRKAAGILDGAKTLYLARIMEYARFHRSLDQETYAFNQVQRVWELLEEARADYREKQALYGLQYPVLLHKDIDLTRLAAASDEEASRLVGGMVDEILDNIEETKDNIQDGDLKIWNLPDIVAMTSQDLKIEANTVLQEAIREHVRRAETAEGILNIALSALGIAAALVAIFATGGLALVAGGVALGVGAYQLSESVQRYMAESAAENVALDALVADISAKEPELFWVVLDIAGLFLDVFDVINAVNKLRRPARALMDTGDIEGFARTVRAALPPAAANRLLTAASRRAAISGQTDNVIRAIGDEFRVADMDLIEGEIRWLAEKGFADIIEDLRILHHIHVLKKGKGEEILESVLGADRAEELITSGYLRPQVGGFYDPKTRRVFVKEGSAEAVQSLLVHEATHYLQDLFKLELGDFSAEFQAFAMQRDYLIVLSREAGSQAVPNEWRWLLDATNEDIDFHIMKEYGYAKPHDFDAQEAVQQVMELLQKFYT